MLCCQDRTCCGSQTLCLFIIYHASREMTQIAYRILITPACKKITKSNELSNFRGIYLRGLYPLLGTFSSHFAGFLC